MSVEKLLEQTARSNLLERTLTIMDSIEYRRVTSAEDLDQIANLRQSAYNEANIYVDKEMSFVDEFDFDPRVFVFGVYFQATLVGTIRIHILSKDNSTSHSQIYYGDILNPLLAQGVKFMDPSRFAIVPGMDKEIPGLASIVLRLGFAAVRYFNCDFGLAMIKEGHGGFYRKIFNYSQISPPIKFPNIHMKFALYSTSRMNTDTISVNYPAMDGLHAESRLLFSIAPLGQPNVLSVRPTARLAIRNASLKMEAMQAAE